MMEPWSGDGQYDLLSSQFKAAEAERDALRTRVGVLEAALRFYANSHHYPAGVCPSSGKVAEDGGKRARAALGETGGGRDASAIRELGRTKAGMGT